MNYANEYIKITAVLFVLLTTMVVGMSGAAMAATQEPAGNGTTSDPYEVTNVEELQWAKNDLDAVYEVQNDIDASGTETWNSGSGFDPVGTLSNPFGGTFDGQNYTIDGLYINRNSSDYVGLFGQNDGTVRNVGVSNVYINGNRYVAGLVGFNRGGDVTRSYSSGNVVGAKYVAGLVGSNPYNNVSKSYSVASVDGFEFVGGLVGLNEGGDVSNSYSVGTVTGDSSVGGLVGSNGGTVSDAYWDTEASGQTSSSGGTGLNTSEMTGDTTNSAAGFDYADTWELVQSTDDDATSAGYPILQSLDREAQLLSQDVTDPVSNYNIEIGVLFNGSLQSNINYVIEDPSNDIVASGQTVSDGPSTETLPEGDYTVSVATQTPRFAEESRDVSLTAQTTESFDLQLEQYNLTINTENSQGDSIDTDYEVLDSDNNTVVSGQTGSDGQVVETLPYDTYTVNVAENDSEYTSGSTTHELTSDYTMSFQRDLITYDLTIQTEDSSGNAINTTYSVLDSDGTEVASGNTGTDGQAVENLATGDYDVQTSTTDPEYDQRSRSVTLDSATTESFNPSLSSYNITIGASDEFEGIETDYEVLDSNDNVVASGTTDPNGTVTETLSAGDYTVEYANNDTEVYSKSESVILNSDEDINPTLDRIELTLNVDSSVIYEGVGTTFDANVSNRADSDYTYDWYVNNESVATGSDDTLNYTFNDSGAFQIRVETTIDGNDYVATRPIPEGVWTDEDVEGRNIPEELETTDKVYFSEIEVKTFDQDGPIVATHILNANLRKNLTGDQINEDRIRVSRKGEVTRWQVIATHDAYVRAEHPDYENTFDTIEYATLASSNLIGVQIGFGEREDENVTSHESRPDSFGYDLIQDAVILDGDGSSTTGDSGVLPGAPIGGGGSGGLIALLGIFVVGASLLMILAGFSIFGLLTSGAGFEVVTGGEESLLDSIPNPLRWLRGND